MPGKDVIFTGSRKINKNNLTVQYLYTDGTKTADSHTEEIDYGSNYSVVSPKIAGCSPETKTVKGKMPDEDVSVTVVYGANEYTITFNTDGGSEIPAITKKYGSKIKAPADPKKEGYIFKGWKTQITEKMPART